MPSLATRKPTSRRPGGLARAVRHVMCGGLARAVRHVMCGGLARAVRHVMCGGLARAVRHVMCGGLARAVRHVIWFRACLGQYPGEKEITFPPYTCLESHGDPRLQRVSQGELVIFPLKVAPSPSHSPRNWWQPSAGSRLTPQKRAADARSSCEHVLRLCLGGRVGAGGCC